MAELDLLTCNAAFCLLLEELALRRACCYETPVLSLENLQLVSTKSLCDSLKSQVPSRNINPLRIQQEWGVPFGFCATWLSPIWYNAKAARPSSERLCVKVVSVRSGRGLTGYVPFLLRALVKRSRTTLHTASDTISQTNVEHSDRESSLRNGGVEDHQQEQ